MSQTVQEQTGQELLSVRGITKRFGLNVVLKGIDLSVGRGEVLTLIGGNGAGKSTLMKIIMGIYQPDQGELYRSEVGAAQPSGKNCKRYRLESGS